MDNVTKQLITAYNLKKDSGPMSTFGEISLDPSFETGGNGGAVRGANRRRAKEARRKSLYRLGDYYKNKWWQI